MVRVRNNRLNKRKTNSFWDNLFKLFDRFFTHPSKRQSNEMAIKKIKDAGSVSITDKQPLKAGNKRNLLSAEITSETPVEKLNDVNVQKALYRLAIGLKNIPFAAMVFGSLLFLKTYDDDKVAYFKVYNLSSNQLKIYDKNPRLLQNYSRLMVALGLSNEQMTAYPEQDILNNPPDDNNG